MTRPDECTCAVCGQNGHVQQLTDPGSGWRPTPWGHVCSAQCARTVDRQHVAGEPRHSFSAHDAEAIAAATSGDTYAVRSAEGVREYRARCAVCGSDASIHGAAIADAERGLDALGWQRTASGARACGRTCLAALEAPRVAPPPIVPVLRLADARYQATRPNKLEFPTVAEAGPPPPPPRSRRTPPEAA
jgi:hypothetical protein